MSKAKDKSNKEYQSYLLNNFLRSIPGIKRHKEAMSELGNVICKTRWDLIRAFAQWSPNW